MFINLIFRSLLFDVNEVEWNVMCWGKVKWKKSLLCVISIIEKGGISNKSNESHKSYENY